MFKAGRPRQKFVSKLEWAIDGAADILDIGTNQRFAKELRKLEPMFEGKGYKAAGYQPSLTLGDYNCDLDLDLCAIALPDRSVDCVLCIEVLEHCGDPFLAARELQRILRPGGALFLTVPFIASYHGHKASQSGSHEEFPDYWRFTHQGLEKLFAAFDELEVVPLDGPLETRVRWTPLVRIVDRFPIRQLLDRFDWPQPGRATTRHMVTGRAPS